MDNISIESLEAIENELTLKAVKEFDIKLDLLFYDPTNFFTYIASDNERSSLAQRGKNKQKRFEICDNCQQRFKTAAMWRSLCVSGMLIDMRKCWKDVGMNNLNRPGSSGTGLL